MDLARVIGTIVATQRDPAFGPLKLAIVQPVDAELKDAGEPVVAIDALNRRRGDVVFLVRSGDAMFAHHGSELVPTDLAIGGLADHLYVEGEAARN